MQGRHKGPVTTEGPAVDPLRRVGAVTWISEAHALVARKTASGWIDVARVDREPTAAGRTYLARVVHEIGDADRVVIMGPDTLRTELEREYVTIFHRPDRLVDVEPAGGVDEAELVARVSAIP
jgi:hypothetical protein